MTSSASTLQKEATPAGLKRKSLNRAKAIREFCVECMNYQLQLVNKCPDPACPLWEWRRGPGGPEPSDVPIRRQVHEAKTKQTRSATTDHGPTP